MHVHSCLSLVEIPDLHVNPPCLWNSNCKYTPVPSDLLFKGPPLPSDSEKLSVVSYGYYLKLPNLFIFKIISRESLDTLAGQIHFSPVTYRQIYNS